MNRLFKDALQKFCNDPQNEDDLITKLYRTATDTQINPVELLEFIDNSGELAYNRDVLASLSKKFGLHRRDVFELLEGICELAGENLQEITKINSFICKPPKTCPFKTEYVLYSYSPRRDHAQWDLNKSDYSHLKLGECRKDNNGWYYLYVFELLEDEIK